MSAWEGTYLQEEAEVSPVLSARKAPSTEHTAARAPAEAQRPPTRHEGYAHACPRATPPSPRQASPRPGPTPSRRPSPLDVALVGQEVVEDPQAGSGLKVPKAHGGSGAQRHPHRSPAAAQRGPALPALPLYSG